MTAKDKAKLAKKIKEVCSPYCTSNWCLLVDMFCSSHDSPRNAVQLKCMAILKLNMSRKEKEDVGWEEAGRTWIDTGMAKYFAEYYNEDLTAEDIFDKVEERAIKEGKYKK